METLKEDVGIFVTHKYKATGQLVRVVPDTKTYWFQGGQPRVLAQDVSNPADIKWAFETELEAV